MKITEAISLLGLTLASVTIITAITLVQPTLILLVTLTLGMIFVCTLGKYRFFSKEGFEKVDRLTKQSSYRCFAPCWCESEYHLSNQSGDGYRHRRGSGCAHFTQFWATRQNPSTCRACGSRHERNWRFSPPWSAHHIYWGVTFVCSVQRDLPGLLQVYLHDCGAWSSSWIDLASCYPQSHGNFIWEAKNYC